jgi:hypothetical protein
VNKTFLVNAFLGSAEFLGAPPAARGHWLGLQRYCSERENGGVLQGARALSAKQWSMVIGAGGGIQAINRLIGVGLAKWAGDHLVVSGYDLESERSYQDRRVRASAGGRAKAARSQERRDQFDEHGSAGVTSSGSNSGATASGSADQREDAEGWGRDGEAERRGGKTRTEKGSAPASVPTNPDQMVELFRSRHKLHLGAEYRPTAVDTMAARNRWEDLEPTELPERIDTYIRTEERGQSSISGFLGWYPGPNSNSEPRNGHARA